jgi:hypothetical protein
VTTVFSLFIPQRRSYNFFGCWNWAKLNFDSTPPPRYVQAKRSPAPGPNFPEVPNSRFCIDLVTWNKLLTGTGALTSEKLL